MSKQTEITVKARDILEGSEAIDQLRRHRMKDHRHSLAYNGKVLKDAAIIIRVALEDIEANYCTPGSTKLEGDNFFKAREEQRAVLDEDISLSLVLIPVEDLDAIEEMESSCYWLPMIKNGEM